MASKVNHGMIMKALDYGYDKAITGMPGMETAKELACDYLDGKGSLQSKANSLVNWQTAKAGTSGFVTGLGGLITLPVAIPVNITSVIYVQLRMIAAIAVMGGYDARKDQVKTLAFMCLCGSAMADVVKDVGINIGSKLTISAINKITGKTLQSINKAVGFRLLTKFGQTGAVNIGKMVPFLGGIIGCTFDSFTTKAIGKVAIKTFL